MDHATSIQRLGADPADREAWAAVVADHGGLCWRIALRMLGDEQTAADAVQDCLLALRAGASRFRPGPDPQGAATAWVARVAVNTCHGHRRRRPAQALVGDLAAAEPPAELAEHLPQLRAAIGELPANQREAVTLRYLAGLDYPALAVALGIEVGAARVRVHRALAALRGLLERRGVALSAVALGGWLDDLAASPPPPPPVSAVSAWTSAALPSLPLLGTGAIAAMIILPVAAVSVLLAVTLAPSAPPPRPQAAIAPPAPVLAVAHQTMDDRLAWLAGCQRPDGAWLPGPGPADEAGTRHATALTVLVFLGAGYDGETPSRYRPVVVRGLAWLKAHPAPPTAAVAEQALAQLPQVEAVAMSLHPRPEAIAPAFDRLLALRTGGGWPAHPGGDGIDARTTALALLVAASARAAGLGQEPAALAGSGLWVQAAWGGRPGEGFPAHTDALGRAQGGECDDVAGSCAAVFTRSGHLGKDRSWQPLMARAQAAARDPIDRWLVTLAAFQAGGGSWERELQGKAALVAAGNVLAESGDLDGVVAATLGWQVHYRFEQVHAAPGVVRFRGDFPPAADLEPVMAPVEQ